MRYRFGELLTLQMNSETARKVVFNGGNVDDRKIYRHRILSIFYTIPRIIVVSTVNENGRAIRARIWRTIYSTSSRTAFQSTFRFFLPLFFFFLSLFPSFLVLFIFILIFIFCLLFCFLFFFFFMPLTAFFTFIADRNSRQRANRPSRTFDFVF